MRKIADAAFEEVQREACDAVVFVTAAVEDVRGRSCAPRFEANSPAAARRSNRSISRREMNTRRPIRMAANRPSFSHRQPVGAEISILVRHLAKGQSFVARNEITGRFTAAFRARPKRKTTKKDFCQSIWVTVLPRWASSTGLHYVKRT